MVLLCPICKSRAQELDRTGDATGFYCTTHGHFKVGDRPLLDGYYTRAEWEGALRSAKHKAMEGEWPVIRVVSPSMHFDNFTLRISRSATGQSCASPPVNRMAIRLRNLLTVIETNTMLIVSR
jgi:hypothetical protein